MPIEFLLLQKKLTPKNAIEYFCYDPKTRHLFRGIIEYPSNKNVEANNLFMEVINNVKFNR